MVSVSIPGFRKNSFCCIRKILFCNFLPLTYAAAAHVYLDSSNLISVVVSTCDFSPARFPNSSETSARPPLSSSSPCRLRVSKKLKKADFCFPVGGFKSYKV